MLPFIPDVVQVYCITFLLVFTLTSILDTGE
jgi:hypothetical protein